MRKIQMSRILLVEDDPNQRLLYQMVLEDDGYEVVIASEGQEALQIVQSGSPDLVILDLALPGMDGIQVLQRIVHSPKTIKPRVIIYTA
jgi:CheY-like chemotaxis protein